MNVGDIYGTLRADGSQFVTDAQKAGDTAGAKAGETFSKKFSAAMRVGAGMAIGAMFGAALSGANELDAATKKLQADTGMTAEAAGVAEKAIAGMYQSNLESFAQIGATMAVVINGLDLTGAAADAMTEKFLKFETATGQDSTAVSAFHEILNAWGLDASSAQHVMDLLVASHQKYGSSVADNQASLQRLAPQMKAMNMTIDDTVNLLNLFDAAGLDASKAQFALNTAVKNLKPGQTFNDLLKQVTAIEDPTLRAQEAIKLFGARGGVGLGNALRPGITSLADFATSASDTVGATDKAAAAVESGFGNQATLLLHNFGGALAEIGTNFGGLAMLAAAVGPTMFRGLAAGFGGMAAMLGPKIAGTLMGPAVQGPVMAGASSLGRAGGLRFGAAFAAGILGVVALGVFAAMDYAAQQEAESLSRFKVDLTKKTDAELQTELAQWKASSTMSWVRDAVTKPIEEELANRKDAIAATAADTFDTIPEKLLDAKNDAQVIASEIPATIASAIRDRRSAVTKAFDQLKADMKDSMATWAEVTRLEGELLSTELADGMASMDPVVAAQAQVTHDEIMKRLNELEPNANEAGIRAGQALYDGLMAGLKKIQQTSWQLPGGTTYTPPVLGSPAPPYSGGGQPGFAASPSFMAYDQPAYAAAAVIPSAGSNGVTIASGAITITGVGNDVSPSAAKRFGQTILDEVAKGLQQQGSRYSEFSGSRP